MRFGRADLPFRVLKWTLHLSRALESTLSLSNSDSQGFLLYLCAIFYSLVER
jgi:hypothetical protein